MIHLTCVAGGPLAHFKTERPRSMRIRAGTHFCVCARTREDARGARRLYARVCVSGCEVPWRSDAAYARRYFEPLFIQKFGSPLRGETSVPGGTICIFSGRTKLDSTLIERVEFARHCIPVN